MLDSDSIYEKNKKQKLIFNGCSLIIVLQDFTKLSCFYILLKTITEVMCTKFGSKS